MKYFILILVGSILSFIITGNVIAQDFPSGFDYQSILRDGTGSPISNTNLDLIVGIYSGEELDILVWEENQIISTNSDGYYQLIIGEGESTGLGLVTDFDAINWSGGNYALNVKIDQGSGFEDFGMNQLYSVPFAYYAKRAENQLYLNNMIDVDTTLIAVNDILRWNGEQWNVYPSSDTVMWASNALNSNYSQYSDTANFAIGTLACPPCDSAIFTFYGDSALWSLYSDTSMFSENSIYSDTAMIALESINSWKLTGNEGLGLDNFIGSTDSNDVSFRSNGSERMRIKANGNIGIGVSDPSYDFQVQGNNGIVFSGDFASETIINPDTGSATFWIPSKAAFRTGYVNNESWDMDNIGDYSFAGGYNSMAKGNYSFAFGQDSKATGEGAIAMGSGNDATGKFSIAEGSNSSATGFGSISLGRLNTVNDSAGIAIGSQLKSYGKYAIAMGYGSRAEADYSIAMGRGAVATHSGSIIMDCGLYSGLFSTAENQFMLRAIGGTIIYSDEDFTTGVSLASGSGSWSTLSDSTKKENFKTPDMDSIISNARDLNVYSWNYKTQNDSIRHLGPMAQDFYNAFNLGENDTTISMVDFDGINLLLLKALFVKEEQLQLRMSQLNDLSLEMEEYRIKNEVIISSLKQFMNISSEVVVE